MVGIVIGNPQCPYWVAPSQVVSGENSEYPNAPLAKSWPATVTAHKEGLWVDPNTGDVQGEFPTPAYKANRSPYAMIGGLCFSFIDSYVSGAPQPVPPPPP